MKRFLKLLAFASIAILFTNCDKDDDNDDASVVGTWKMAELKADNGTATFDLLGVPVTGTFTILGSNFNTTTTFTANPNVFTSSGSYTTTVTTNFLGQIDTVTETVDVDGETGSWNINGDKLQQILLGDTTDFTILELSDAKLRLRLDLDESFIDQGTEYHQTATIFTSFDRQ